MDCLAIIGLLLLIPLGEASSGIDLIGAAYALGPVSAGRSIFFMVRRRGNDNGVQTAALGVMIAALFVAPIGIVHAGAALLTPALIPVAIGVAILHRSTLYLGDGRTDSSPCPHLRHAHEHRARVRRALRPVLPA
jgi:inner membrane transporter RhtA